MYNSADVTWTLVAAFMVFFMQAGFALCEAGLTRAKNTGNILMKNMMDFCIGTPCYWLVGFGVMFAGTGAFIGGFDRSSRAATISAACRCGSTWCSRLCSAPPPPPSFPGSMAERTKLQRLLPLLCGHQPHRLPHLRPLDLGRRLLSQLGFHDFAGSTAVHFVGGVTACLGAWMLGPPYRQSTARPAGPAPSPATT